MTNNGIQNKADIFLNHYADTHSMTNTVTQNKADIFLNHYADTHSMTNTVTQNKADIFLNQYADTHSMTNNGTQNKAVHLHQPVHRQLTKNNINRNKLLYKKVLLIFSLVFLWCSKGFSQGMPVYDNTNFLALGKSIIESAKQTSQMIKTVKFLKDQKERVDKINSAVKQLKSIKELQDNNTYLYNTVKRDLREILNSPYIKIEEVTTISNSFNAIVNNSVQSLELVNQILKRDFFKMNDSERFMILEEHKKRSNEMVSDIRYKTKIYYEIIEFREMQDLVTNRDAIK